MLHGKTLHLEANTPDDVVVTSLKALASTPRWRILQFLADGGRSVNEVARALNMPPSTAAAQIKILEEAKFLRTELHAATHGLQKVCTRTYDNLLVHLPHSTQHVVTSVEVAMPIGSYSGFDVTPTCGLASSSSLIGFLDDPLSFYEPERTEAGLIWFRSGHLDFTFPNRLPRGATPSSLVVSMEICSEAPSHNDDWPSDITLWVNQHEVGTWTCPADFGGQRGRTTPSWWESKDSQFGVLKRWLVNKQGSFIDGHSLSSLSIDDLDLPSCRVITVRLGVKSDALHVGGINLFGRSFGNYPQDITMRIDYTPGQHANKTKQSA